MKIYYEETQYDDNDEFLGFDRFGNERFENVRSKLLYIKTDMIPEELEEYVKEKYGNYEEKNKIGVLEYEFILESGTRKY